MKTTQKIVLLLSLMCSIMLPQSSALTPENTVIACDIDKVVLRLPRSQWPKIALKSAQLVHNGQDAIDLPKTLYHIYQDFYTEVNGINQCYGNVNGLIPQMLTIGMRHNEATRFIAPFLEIVEASRRLDKEVIKVLQDTKLPIVWTTNKDSLTYQGAVKVHGLNALATKAIVTKQPLSAEVIAFAQRADTPESYRALVEQYENDQETNTIFHAPGKKPNAEYYQYVEKIVGPEKNIIFIDNKKKNVYGYIKALLSSDTAQRIGIHYQGKPAQLKSELAKLNIQQKK